MSDGGADDPCALNNNNDANDGLDKDPSLCVNGDTFFLWDEPDTQVSTRRYRLIEPRVADWPVISLPGFTHNLHFTRTGPQLRVGGQRVAELLYSVGDTARTVARSRSSRHVAAAQGRRTHRLPGSFLGSVRCGVLRHRQRELHRHCRGQPVLRACGTRGGPSGCFRW